MGRSSNSVDGGGIVDANTTSYRFYSRQTTVGRVASSIASNLGDERASEFLARCPPPSHVAGDVTQPRQQRHRGNDRYRRLPNTMTLHDAERAGWVQEFDAILVLVYPLAVRRDGVGTMVADGEDGDRGPSKSVLDPDSKDDEVSDGDDDKAGVGSDDRGCPGDDTRATVKRRH